MKAKWLLGFMLICLPIGAMHRWIVPAGRNVQTIYFQGIFACQMQAAKYCGPSGLRATTGERIVCPHSNMLIYHPYIGVELDDIVLENESTRLPFAWMQRRIVGMIERDRYHFELYDRQAPGKPTVAHHTIDLTRLNLGQERDIQNCSKKVAQCAQDYPDADIILWGVSRGAAAVFNAHARHKYDNVKLIVLEGGFDTLDHVMAMRAPWLLKKLGFHTIFLRFLSSVTEYRRNGISPLESVERFPEDVPVLFITSQADTVVHSECADNLAIKLFKRGKNPVHYLKLKDATHNIYSLGEGEDQKRYRKVLHGIYKEYGLPYILEYLD